MTRKLKVLGIALVAVFAMSAVAASAASAKKIHSGSGSGTTFITGVQVGVNAFDLENGAEAECATTEYEASYTGTEASELSVTPIYKNCKTFGQKATIDTNGCTYTFTTPTETTDPDHYHAVVHVICPTVGGVKQAIKITALGCTVTVEEQTPTEPIVDITDVTTATANQDDLLLKSTVTGVKYTSTGGSCGPSGEGKLTGEVTAKGYSNAAHTTQVDLWVA